MSHEARPQFGPMHAMPDYEVHPFENTMQLQESAERMNALIDTAEGLERALPEYTGLTLFGSSVRGEARQDSDVDIFVYVEEADQAPIQQKSKGLGLPPTYTYGDDGALAGTTAFNLVVSGEYKQFIRGELEAHNLPDADITVLPISKEIVHEQTEKALEAAEAFDLRGINNGAVAPRNIRGLFHMGIDTVRLQPYIQQVINTYSNSPHGETAWDMLRFVVASFEVGGDGGARAKEPVTHRTLPRNLKEARLYYGLDVS